MCTVDCLRAHVILFAIAHGIDRRWPLQNITKHPPSVICEINAIGFRHPMLSVQLKIKEQEKLVNLQHAISPTCG